METFHMSQKELGWVAVFEQLKSKTIKQKEAAKMLDLSVRQIKRKLKSYRVYGMVGLIHQSRGKPSNHALAEKMKRHAIDLVSEEYPDFGPTFAAEKLREEHDIVINRETLRLLMIGHGLWSAGKRKTTHRAWRERKACLGELVQLDGSPHAWFEDRGDKCTLLAFIDDATSQIMHLEFIYEEATIPVMQATKRYLERHGRPVELYVDRGKVFKVNQHNPDNDKITQYGRAVNELGIKLSFARSPEAKGRVERLFKTLQDRLVKELRLANISTMTEANIFLQSNYVAKHNEKFAVAPRESNNLHQSIDGYNLTEILSIKEERVLTSDFTIQYHNRWFQLGATQPTLLFPKNSIVVSQFLDNTISLSIRQMKLQFTEIPKPVRKPVLVPTRCVVTTPWKPASNHPWRQYQNQQKVTFLNC